MNVFQEEVAERKKIASGARHKRGGDSKHCHLSSDDLTPKQLKSLHGQVATYQLGKPMIWAEFTAMPRDLQKMYVERLIEKYSVTNTRLAVMFGVGQSYLSQCLVAIGIRRRKGGSKVYMTPEQVEAWEQFLAQETK